MHNIGPLVASFQVSLETCDVERLGEVLKNGGRLTIQVGVTTPIEVFSMADLTIADVMATPATTEDSAPEATEPVVTAEAPTGQKVVPAKFEVWLPEDVVAPSTTPPPLKLDSAPPAAPADEHPGPSTSTLPRTAPLRARMAVQVATTATTPEDTALAQILAADTPWVGPRWREAHNISEEIADALIARGALTRHPQHPDTIGPKGTNP